MSKRASRVGAAVAVLLLSASAMASADPTAPAQTPQATPASSAPATADAAQTTPVVYTQPAPAPVLSPAVAAEARAAGASAAGAIASMEATASRVRKMLRRARTRGVSREIACVDEGLSRADVAVRHARDDAKAAAEAYAHSDVAEARKAIQRIMLGRAAAQNAASVADACFAGDAAPSAKATGTQVSVYVAPANR